LPKLKSLGVALCLAGSTALPAFAQNSPQKELTVVVVNAHADPSQPVQGVRVSLSFVAGSEKVVDSRDATNRSGQAVLLVSPEAAQRDDLRVEISGTSDLVVFQPADGQLSGLPASVTVRLLPKGSVLLLGPPQIEAMLQRMSIQNRAKNQEIRELKAELAGAQSQKPDDLTAAMTEWAKNNGLDVADVDKQVQQWATDIQNRKDQATANEKALAELALKHYGAAAQLFDQAADDDDKAMEESKQRFLEQDRKMLRALVDKKFQSANAYQLNLQFHQATVTLTQARDRAAAEHTQYPDDAALRSIWLDAVLRLANARRDEGDFGAAGDSATLLAESIKDYQTLLPQRAAPDEKQDWAMAQLNLGIALDGQALRSSGAQGADLLGQAVSAYRSALQVYTKAGQPKEWARAEMNVGNALLDQGERSNGAKANELLAQAVVAYRAALEVRTRVDLPLEWANTQNNLGRALSGQAQRSSGAQSADLMVQAIAAYRAALEAETKTGQPQDWARVENNLGIALEIQGERANGAQAMDLLAQAAQAYRASLEVRTKANLPQDWAGTENNLGGALMEQGVRSNGAQAMDLLAQAVEAYRAALEVRTKTALPQDWAETENNLGDALVDQGLRSSGAQATDLLAQAVDAYRADLEVYTKQFLPQDWAMTQNNLGLALVDQGEMSRGKQATDLIGHAVDAYRAALEVYTKADLPHDWAMTQNNLGLALRDLGERSSGAQAKELFTQAIRAYQSALEVYSTVHTPFDWAATENNLSNALVDEGDFPAAAKAIEAVLEVFPNDVGYLQTAVSIYHDNLFRYDRSYELAERWLKLDDSPVARLSVEENDLVTGRFEECEKQAAAIGDTSFPNAPGSMTMIRDTIRMSCQWGAGQKADAQQTAQALLSKSAQLQNIGWEFTGTEHFLGSSQAFVAGRTSWVSLFQSLEKGDGAIAANSLHQLEEVMRN
jgi:tetratricopeptide (TPR) repeat protein